MSAILVQRWFLNQNDRMDLLGPPALSIVVPYRDRPAHLARFTEHVAAYFERDKADRHIPYRVLIVEQLDGLPFNLGALRNIGFTLGAAASAYTCFHDLDYLPIWADYAWCEAATPLVWYGAESRPVAPGRSPNRVGHTLDSFWGGAVLMPNAAFAAIDGYSNGYWGWGSEDVDLERRCRAAGLPTGRRRGTYLALDHDSRGFRLDCELREIARLNQRRLAARWAAGATPEPDGLSTLAYTETRRERLALTGRGLWERIGVHLEMTPGPEVFAALEADAAVG